MSDSFLMDWHQPEWCQRFRGNFVEKVEKFGRDFVLTGVSVCTADKGSGLLDAVDVDVLLAVAVGVGL